jgi:exoribonuclease R
MSKLHLTVRIPPDYDRQTWFGILSDIEKQVNAQIDGYLFPTSSVTADYTATVNDSFIPVNATSGAVTVTLKPAGEAEGKRLTVKKTDASANAVTIDGDGSETIDDATTVVMNSQYESICVLSDGVEWWVV